MGVAPPHLAMTPRGQHRTALVGSRFRWSNLEHFQLTRYAATNRHNYAANAEDVLHPADVRPFGAWFRSRGLSSENVQVVATGGIFAVARSDARRPGRRERYRTLMEDVATHSNPEAGHYIERSWAAIFGPLPCHVEDDAAVGLATTFLELGVVASVQHVLAGLAAVLTNTTNRWSPPVAPRVGFPTRQCWVDGVCHHE